MSCRVTLSFFLLQPREVGRRSFSAVKGISEMKQQTAKRTHPSTRRTEKVLNKRSVRRSSLRVSERDDRRRQLSQAELLHGGGEGVGRVESARVDLARELAVGELLGGHDAGGPEFLRGGKDRGVEEVVAAVVIVHAAVGVECQFEESS